METPKGKEVEMLVEGDGTCMGTEVFVILDDEKKQVEDAIDIAFVMDVHKHSCEIGLEDGRMLKLCGDLKLSVSGRFKDKYHD